MNGESRSHYLLDGELSLAKSDRRVKKTPNNTLFPSAVKMNKLQALATRLFGVYSPQLNDL